MKNKMPTKLTVKNNRHKRKVLTVGETTKGQCFMLTEELKCDKPRIYQRDVMNKCVMLRGVLGYADVEPISCEDPTREVFLVNVEFKVTIP